ncbi:MAG: preprotein translocase subunit YajC [Patescibacteria group bacterium]|jgi:preprotein translocase subunit YajC
MSKNPKTEYILMEFTNLLLPLMLFATIYFFFIRPQQKIRNEQQSFVDTLEKGAEVVTNGGIIGRINKIDGNVVTLQIDTKTFVRVAKSYISKELTEAIAKGENAEA